MPADLWVSVRYLFCEVSVCTEKEFVGWNQATIGNGTRSSSATAYLSDSTTSRPNLDVLLNTKVTRVLPGTSKGSFSFVEIDGM